MLLLTMLIATVAGACLYAIWPMLGAPFAPFAAGKPSGGPAAEDPPAAGRRETPESLEGVLVAQLAAGEINRRQYHRAMEQAAARDDESSVGDPSGGRLRRLSPCHDTNLESA